MWTAPWPRRGSRARLGLGSPDGSAPRAAARGLPDALNVAVVNLEETSSQRRQARQIASLRRADGFIKARPKARFHGWARIWAASALIPPQRRYVVEPKVGGCRLQVESCRF